jgi:hypothetical protein
MVQHHHQIRPYKYIHATFLNPNLQHCTRHKHRGNSHNPSFLTSLHFLTLPGPLNLHNFQETPRVYLETSLQPPIDMSQNILPDMHTQWPPTAALPNPYVHLQRPCMEKYTKNHQKKRNICIHEWMRTNRGQFSQQRSPTREIPPISEPTTARAAIYGLKIRRFCCTSFLTPTHVQ